MSRLSHPSTFVRTLSLFLLAAAVSSVLFSASGAEASGSVTVTVNNTAIGALSTQLSTNNVWSGLLAQNATAVANFKALAMPLARIHVGDDGYPIAMPETKAGSWSFAALNTLVNDSFDSGQTPLMNIKFAPDWQWTCTTLYTQGTVRDQSFGEYADYMARLVSYYNKGSMTTESGQVITNPSGTSHRIVYWEPWNEPDLNNETPCAPSTGVALTPTQYVTMWNAVTAKMLAVDPGLRFIGPATAGGQFGSGTAASQDYFTPLMQQSVQPFALSFHGYGYWDNTVSDQTIFNGDGSGYPDGGIDDMVTTTNRLRSSFPTTPIWLDEMNVNADWGADTHQRPWTQYGAAWWGAAYAALAPLHVEMLHQYNVMDGPQFGLLNDQTGAPFMPYWEFKLLNESFPVGSTQLQSSSSSTNIPVISATRADGKISIMVVNRTVDPAAPAAGIGLPADVVISLSGISPTAINLQQIDSTTSVTSGPAVTSLPVSNSVSLHFPGYGLAVITVTQGQTAAVSPSNTTAPAVSGTPQVGQALTVSQGTWSGSPSSYSYQWQSSATSSGTFANIVGATSSTYTPASAQQSLYLRAVVTASNAQGSNTAAANSVGPVAAALAPPVNTSAPVVSGTPQVGQVLTVSQGTWSGSPSSYSYQWQLSATSSGSFGNIVGATSSTYTLTSAQQSLYVRAVVTASNAQGSNVAAATSVGSVAALAPPVNTSAPVISGPAYMGQAVTVSPGTWSGNPTSYSYQWQSSGSSTGTFAIIVGATSNTYTANSTQQSLYLRAVVSAINPQGSNAAMSNIEPVASAPVSAPSVTLTPTSLSFGSQAVGVVGAAQTVTVQNSGDAPLTISSIGLTGANASEFAQTSTCPLAPSTLAATANCTVSVSFTPGTAGDQTGSVAITDNAGNGSQLVSLTGSGVTVTTGAGVSPTPTSLKFGRQTISTSSTARLITFKNTGNVPVTISTIAVTGTNAGEFGQTSDCPRSTELSPGASCAISVTFTPGAAGKRKASITITHSASTSATTVALAGTGVYLVDGFERGALTGWTATGAGGGVQTSVEHAGSYAAALTPSSVGSVSISAPLVALGQTQTWTRFYFRYSALSGTVPIAFGVDATGMKLWQIDFVGSRTALRVTLWNGAGVQTSFDTTAGSFASNEWNSVELRFRGTKSGYAELWENGTSMGAVLANLATASAYSRLCLANTAGSATTYYDDVVVSSLYNGTA